MSNSVGLRKLVAGHAATPASKKGRSPVRFHKAQIERLKTQLAFKPAELISAVRGAIEVPKFAFRWADDLLPDPWGDYPTDVELLEPSQFSDSHERQRLEQVAREFLLNQRTSGHRCSLYFEKVE